MTPEQRTDMETRIRQALQAEDDAMDSHLASAFGLILAERNAIRAYLTERRDYWRAFIQECDFLGPATYPVGMAEGLGLAVQQVAAILDGPQP